MIEHTKIEMIDMIKECDSLTELAAVLNTASRTVLAISTDVEYEEDNN